MKKIEEHINEYTKAQLERTNELKRSIHLFIKDKIKEGIKK